MKNPISVYNMEMNSNTNFNKILNSINIAVCEPVDIGDIHGRFLEIASTYSDKTAIFDSGISYSYSRLFQDMAIVSNSLIEAGIKEGDVVAVIIDRNYNYFVSILAVLNCGAAFLPVDPSSPLERIEFFCSDASVSLILSDVDRTDFNKSVELLNVAECLKNKIYTSNPTLTYNPDLAAYLIYTSGSTGQPKGVKISRKALVNFISGAISLYQISPEDRILQFSNLAFDASIEEIFCSFCTGASLYLRSSEMLLSDELINFSLLHQITVWDLPTAFWRHIIHTVSYQNNPLPDHLRLVIIGGEAVTKNDVFAWNKTTVSHRLFNTYGPTETTVVALAYEIIAGYSPEGLVPIGRPLPGYKLFITDENQKPVPPGTSGELLISGDSVAIGYLNRKTEEERAFIWIETEEGKLQRCYRTGDMVTANEDGIVFYQGRVDRQVKIRGYRIELGEIESTLSSYEGIQDTVVILREDRPGDKRLVAYLLRKSEDVPNAEELLLFSKRKLPEYMVPSSFVFLKKFPLSKNGKIDTKAFPAPVSKIGLSEENYSVIQTKTENDLVLIWKEILNIDNVCVKDNFFELGGHSLLATMVISRIQEIFSVRLPLRSIFEKQTLDELAAEIDKQITGNQIGEEKATIPHLESDSDVFPVSSGQKRLWFIENLEHGSLAYPIPLDYKIKGEIDLTIFEQSINELINRHAILRTTIPTIEGIPVQKISPNYSFRLEVVNLEELPENEKLRVAERYSHENETHIFDLSSGPLFIGKLLKISSNEYTFLLNFHHVITDGWSIQILLEELGLIYTALKQQKSVNLPTLPVTYADFAIWQNEWLEGEGCQKQISYWKNELKGAPDLLQLPMDFRRPKNNTYDGDEICLILDESVTEKLQQFSRNNNVSIFVTLLSAFNTLLTRHVTQEEFIIGIPIAGRIHRELESLCGMLINNFPLRITPKEQMTFFELLEHCKAKFFQAYDHQELPMDRIVEELKVTRHGNISPLFQVMFNLLNMFDQEISLAGSMMEMVDRRRHISQFDLSLDIYESKKTLRCVFIFNTNLFKRERIERMAGHFSELVNSLLSDPGQNIRKIPILSSAEKKLILKDWNETTTTFPKDKCVHQLFEEQVLKTPEAVAVQDDNLTLTYRELNNKANKLARHLHQKGASEGSFVGVFLDRNVDLLVGLLAILKAGCTYIPLDPIYPKDRLALILEDSQPVLLLTEMKLLNSLPETIARNIFIEEIENYHHESEENANFNVTSNHAAYLIYTSGSTGKPKGVMIEHRSMVNFLASMGKKPGIIASDVMLAITTISFDIAGLELFLPILNGSRIVITTQETSMNPELLIKKIEECQPTFLQATPVTFRMLNSTSWTGSKKLKILCGGEALPKELALDLISKCGELWNMYGPTETTVWSTVEKVTVDHADRIGYVNLGRPIDNTTIYVLNSEFQPAPLGIPGELFIGGDGLARGYHNLPELTREKFLPDPFSEIEGSRMYRTGDLVVQTEDGKLEFLNRVDSQVKIRGFRIELGEIESAISQFPSIRDNVVVVREDTPGDQRIIAYIIRKLEIDTDISELRMFLKTKVPDYMVPSSFVFIEQFPLTPNGKIDRKAFPRPEDNQQDSKITHVEPQTEMERKLALIWCEVLKVNRIGIDEGFFDIGGHSMLAITLMIKIEKELGIRFPLSTLFNNSTIREMADFFGKEDIPVKWGSLVPIKTQGSKRPLYLVHGAGLNLLLYKTLVSHLDADQPVFGLQAKGLDGVNEPLKSIEEIAAYYIQEILTIDNSGTYALAGFSLGGQLAYEMARQLLLMDKKVSFLGVFDTSTYNVSDKNLPLIQRYGQRLDWIFNVIIWNIGTFIKKPADKRFEFFTLKLNSIIQKITRKEDKIEPAKVSDGKQKELPKYLHKVHRANLQALDKYILSEYPGKLHLFRALDQSFYLKDPILYGWDKYVKGGVEVLDIPGEHSRIFAPPNDKYFADTLQKCLNQTSKT